jgi:hypothetical protein
MALEEGREGEEGGGGRCGVREENGEREEKKTCARELAAPSPLSSLLSPLSLLSPPRPARAPPLLLTSDTVTDSG